MEFDKVRQKIVIRSGDRIEFVEELLKWGAIGAKRQSNSVPRLYAPFTAELEIMVNPSTPFKDTHCVRAYPPDHRICAYMRVYPCQLQGYGAWTEDI